MHCYKGNDYDVVAFTFDHQELDFLVEAKNSEKCLGNFQKQSPHIAEFVYAPKVHWNLSTSKLLTMEFIDGAQVNDVKSIQNLGIQPNEVATLVSVTLILQACFVCLKDSMVKKLPCQTFKWPLPLEIIFS